MQIDSMTLFAIVKEMRKLLIFAQVRKIHQINPRIFVIELFCPDSQQRLLVINTYTPPLLYISEAITSGYSPSQTFCMSLRKHLEGSRISRIEQITMDRVLEISFDRIEAAGKIKTKKLYFEMIPSAPNLILTEDGSILDACLKGKKQDRYISPKETYNLPSLSGRMNFLDFDAKELEGLFSYEAASSKSDSMTIEKFIYTTFNGFSKHSMEELLYLAEIPADKAVSELTSTDSKRVSIALERIKKKLDETSSLKLYTNHGKEFVSPIVLASCKLPYTKISPLVWLRSVANTPEKLLENDINSLTRKINSLLKREERKIVKLREEMEETKKMRQYRLWGDILAIHAGDKVLGRAEITVDNLFTDPATPVTIPLNPLLTLAANSQRYYRQYNKMKTRVSIGQKQLDEANKKIEFLQNCLFFTKTITDQDGLQSLEQELVSYFSPKLFANKAIKQKTSRRKTFLAVNFDGFTIYIGRNNVENEELTLHKADKDDLWLHARGIPGSHVIIACKGQDVPAAVLSKAAGLAAWYSKGKDSGKVDIDYTRIRNVNKIPSGPPGLVTYTKQKTMTVIPAK
ncbi:MAG: NFACT family protein [Dialister sp.]|nr:NFACT family protein [Dialister sp.]